MRKAIFPEAVFALALLGCEPERPVPREEVWVDEELAPQVLEERESDPDEPPPPAISEHAGPIGDETPEPPPIVAAATVDREYDSEELLALHRYVYRVTMTVPEGLGEGADHLALPSAELFVDVSPDRLRARFAGAGWPVPAGSEVRMRGDRPGVYLFDDEGGRPLEPGSMSQWFEGGRVTRRGPGLRVMPPFRPARRRAGAQEPPEPPPGGLVCALLAELAGEPYENVMRRCERGAPFSFRLGFWRAEQTAAVHVELARSALRADEASPPEPVPMQHSRAFLEPDALGRITPVHPGGEPQPDAPPEGLVVINDGPTRAIITVQGRTIGWVDPSERAHFVGLRPGEYELGAIRPLGGIVARSRSLTVPGVFRLCDPRCPRVEQPE